MYFYCICGKEGDLRVLLFRYLLLFSSSINFVFLLSLFVHSLGLQFLAVLTGTSYITAAFTLASGHPGLEIKILYSIQYRTVKYTKAQPLVDDVCT